MTKIEIITAFKRELFNQCLNEFDGAVISAPEMLDNLRGQLFKHGYSSYIKEHTAEELYYLLAACEFEPMPRTPAQIKQKEPVKFRKNTRHYK